MPWISGLKPGFGFFFKFFALKGEVIVRVFVMFVKNHKIKTEFYYLVAIINSKTEFLVLEVKQPIKFSLKSLLLNNQ